MAKKSKTQKKVKKVSRPPIITVLGHVDHGKTTLLDYIRKTKVAAQEKGGITQSIGAYQVKMATKEGERVITFIDTPGHEAFSKMRSRGAKVADLAILLIAADDGVMPQTVEAINHLRAANVPFLVAINKIDLPKANIEKVKKQLVKHNVLVEGYGGDTVVVPISAKTGKGVDELLEMILLLSDLADISANEENPLSAVVIESRLDPYRGATSTVIIRDGSLSVGDKIEAEGYQGKVRRMINDAGKQIKIAYPGQPVEIDGWKEVPPVGAKVTRVDGTKKTITKSMSKTTSKPLDKPDTLKVVLKAASRGALEALQQSLTGLVNIVHSGIGDISESDILFAKTTDSIVIGYGTKILPAASELAEQERVVVKTDDIIYRIIEEITEVVQAMKEGGLEEILGKAEILAKFSVKKRDIAGVKVINGRLARGDEIKLLRHNQEIGRSKIISLRIGKQDVSRVETPKECGVGFSPQSPLDFKIGDIIISYRK